MLYNLLWKYNQGHYHSQLFPPLLLYLLVPTLAIGAPHVASCVRPYFILTNLGGQIYIKYTSEWCSCCRDMGE